MAAFPGIHEWAETMISPLSPQPGISSFSEGQAGEDHQFMGRALRLAQNGCFTSHPNPRVGCVITKDGMVVGEGWHQFAGEAHAEVHALRQAGKRAQGGTLYVNLEPCSIHGRTPPCTDAIIQSGIRRVVCAMADPNPRVNGTGISALRQAGILVQTGPNHQQALRLNRGFVRRMTQGIPWVTLKVAASLDGMSAMKNGESQWITGQDARRDAHRLRASSAAIITGIGTVLRDNPRMTVRIQGLKSQPLRVIMDSRLSTPLDAAILSGPGRVLILTAPEMIQDASSYPHENVEVHACPMQGDSMDLQEALRELGRREINEVMLEAGPRLGGAMLAQELVDELVIYMAPDLLGCHAKSMFQIPGLESLTDRLRLTFQDIRRIGRDVRLILAVGPENT